MYRIIGKKILVLTAHPDDESFVCGGTIYLNNKNGGETYLSCATCGERGRSSLGTEISDEEVKNIRSEELSEAIKELGITKSYLLDFPDKELSKYKKELLDKWREIINKVKPDIILGFGKDGYTGHLDHIIAGSIAHKLSEEFKIPYIAFCLPAGKRRTVFEGYFKNKRAHGVYSDENDDRGPGIYIEVDPDIKYEIIRIYKSQFPALDPHHIFSKENAEHFLRHEHFVEY